MTATGWTNTVVNKQSAAGMPKSSLAASSHHKVMNMPPADTILGGCEILSASAAFDNQELKHKSVQEIVGNKKRKVRPQTAIYKSKL